MPISPYVPAPAGRGPVSRMPLSSRTLRTADDRLHVADHPGLGGGNAWHIADRTPASPRPACGHRRPAADQRRRPGAGGIQPRPARRAHPGVVGVVPRPGGGSARPGRGLHRGLIRGPGPAHRPRPDRGDPGTDRRPDAVKLAPSDARHKPVGIWTPMPGLALLETLAGDGSCPRTVDAHPRGGGRHRRRSAARRRAVLPRGGRRGRHRRLLRDDRQPQAGRSCTYRQSVAGARFRLATYPEASHSIMLSATPHSHTSAVAFTYYAVLAGLPLVAVNDQSGQEVALHIATYRPTKVLAFNQTFADLATMDLEPTDFTSVEEWMNLGDSAHDAHMRPLMRLGSAMPTA